MFYCDVCTKMMDEDVQFCPHCNNEDKFWTGDQNIITDAPEKLKTDHMFRGEVYDRLREINKHISKNPRPEPRAPYYEEKPGAFLYIFFIMVASCFSLIGLIIGIAYIMKRNQNYKTLGVVTFTVSLMFIFFYIVMFVSFIIVGVL